MIEVVVNVDTSKFDRAMADFPVRIAQAQSRALWYIGQAVASRATQAFRTAAFRPSPWAPRKKKGDGHPLLIRSGNLRQSITWRFNGSDSVVVGSPARYAIYHQMGTKRMPARPFFPIDERGQLTPTAQRDIKDNVEAIYKKEIDKVFGNGGG